MSIERERRSQDVQLADDVAAIRKDVDSILHGNGRKGLWALSDAVFGPPGDKAPGLQERVKILAEARERELNLREGSRRTLVALGTAIVAISGLGAGIGWRVLQALGEITSQLP